jgi:cell division protein ZapA (FtsZ GTPase activity inhibitor)
MANRDEVVQVQVAGHEIRLTAKPEERRHVDRAASTVTERIQKLQDRFGGAASPAKLATMTAFQFAFELSLADDMLADAQRLHDELQAEKEAVKRLESLLARVDDALAY